MTIQCRHADEQSVRRLALVASGWLREEMAPFLLNSGPMKENLLNNTNGMGNMVAMVFMMVAISVFIVSTLVITLVNCGCCGKEKQKPPVPASKIEKSDGTKVNTAVGTTGSAREKRFLRHEPSMASVSLN